MKRLILLSVWIMSFAYAQSDIILQKDWSNLIFQKQMQQEREILLDKKTVEVEAVLNLKENLSTEVVKYQQVLSELKRQQLLAARDRQALVDSEKFLKLRQDVDPEIIKANPQFMNCDLNTPEISLEEKLPYPGAVFQGPFYGVPRDNQASFNTCYANTAKNLLVGTSQGKDVASFLDLALLSKGDSGVVSSALAGGESCSALSKLKTSGYCPQSFAPIESGDKNIYVEGLMGKGQSSAQDLSVVIGLLQEFLSGQNKIVKTNSVLSEQMLKQAQVIIQQINARPNVKIPMPIVRSQIPAQWTLNGLSRSNKKINKEQLLFDYKKEYRNFYPLYVRSVIEGKDRSEIFKIFLEKMKPFINKYQIADQMNSWKIDFFEQTEADWKNPKLKAEIADSLALMKVISGNREFCDETLDDSFDSLQFLSTLQPLVKHLKFHNVDSDILLDEKGRFKSPTELMQLVVAPACLNKQNRKMPEAEILCDQGVSTLSLIRFFGKSPEAQIKMFRERVLASLLQGYPLGNNGNGHINTIVGLRFNKTTKECEIKIRESQNGLSAWQSEQSIFSQIQGLTEVRRSR